ncbi:MAG: C-GCAxxG-C-C family protein [Planctomycetota bacterium]|nr:C-GCAxxG-C-C family protein [Planctomycetota bacterium]
MTSNPQDAVAMFKEGYNCAQAVFAACSAPYGVPRETAVRVAQAFGGGMGRTGNVCGAVTGALMLIGFHRAALDPKDAPAKLDAHRLAQSFLAAFAARHHSLLCRDLLGCDLGTPEGLKQAQEKNLHATVCAGLVESAAGLIEQVLAAKE